MSVDCVPAALQGELYVGAMYDWTDEFKGGVLRTRVSILGNGTLVIRGALITDSVHATCHVTRLDDVAQDFVHNIISRESKIRVVVVVVVLSV